METHHDVRTYSAGTNNTKQNSEFDFSKKSETNVL